jgi:PAS domain S-box-containing protein
VAAPAPDLGDLSSEGILVLDAAGTVLRANRRAHELMRGLLVPLEGAAFWDTLPEDVAEEHHAHARRALQSGRAYTFLDRDEFAARWIEYAISQNGELTVVHLRNVSERHRLMGLLRDSERRGQGLFESNPNIMWVVDIATLDVLAANRAAVRFYGYSQSEFLAMTANKLYPSSDERDLRQSLPALEAHPQGAGAMRLCKHRKRDGQVQMVEVSGLSIEWSGKRAVLVTVADVTTRYLADAQLRQENTELEQRVRERTQALQDSLRELGSLQYAMSHDMQSPLHAVDGFTKVLASQFGDRLGEQGLHYLGRIEAATGKMARLIEDLRLLSRVSRLTMNPATVDVTPLAVSIVESLRQRDKGRDVALEIEPSIRVHADPELLTTALMALIDNAWKFTSKKEQGWIKVGLALGRRPRESVLYVSDNGAGYDPAYAGKLFTAFQRLHSSADFPGAGLGLAIVQRVVSRHGGNVWGESTPMSGATFYISLPRPDAAQSVPDDTLVRQVQIQAANR